MLPDANNECGTLALVSNLLCVDLFVDMLCVPTAINFLSRILARPFWPVFHVPVFRNLLCIPVALQSVDCQRFLSCGPVSPDGSYEIWGVIRCQINEKKSPTKSRILLLQADVLTISNRMRIHLCIDNPGCNTLTSPLGQIYPSYLGSPRRNAVSTILSFCYTCLLTRSSFHCTWWLSDALLLGAHIFVRKDHFKIDRRSLSADDRIHYKKWSFDQGINFQCPQLSSLRKRWFLPSSSTAPSWLWTLLFRSFFTVVGRVCPWQ